MPQNPLVYILGYGILMSLFAFAGAIFYVFPEKQVKRFIFPMVAFAAGALWGGAFFHMLPKSIEAIGDTNLTFLWLTAGFVIFLVLHQLIHWHHCHNLDCDHGHRPLGTMVLIADGLHNLLGGLGIGALFMVDIKVGTAAFVAAVLHEIPQEIGDFGLLVHAGWTRGKALLFNFFSALTFPLGGVIAYMLDGTMNVAYLAAIAAGNFVYIAAADLTPELAKYENVKKTVTSLFFFLLGMGLLYLGAEHGHHH
jgi:zinc and cadmium transporter